MFKLFFAYFGLDAHLAAVLASIATPEARTIAAAPRERPPFLSADGVALIPINGPMLRGIGADVAEWYGATDTDVVNRQVRLATESSAIDSIIIKVNSPGGSVDGVMELADRIKTAAAVKPTVAVVDGMAASAAYWAISGASKIIAGPRDLVGSIGARLMVTDSSAYYESLGIKVTPVDTGEFKSAGAEGTVVTDAHLADFQRIVDGYFSDFASAVQSGRGLDAKQFAAVADGRVFFANESPTLVDGVGSFESVLKSMQETSAARQRLAQM